MKLIYKTIAVKLWELREQLRVRKAFYNNSRFREVDKALEKAYFFENPHTISRKFLQEKGEDEIYTYGETPLITMYHVVKKFGISSHDRVLDLGCGRGRAAFFLSYFVGCKAVGVDFVPEFIEKAQKIVQTYTNHNIGFHCQDILDVDMSNFDVIYLCGTCLEDELIKKILERLPSRAKIITVSYPLSDYDAKFSTKASFEAYFPWGSTTIFLSQSENGLLGG